MIFPKRIAPHQKRYFKEPLEIITLTKCESFVEWGITNSANSNKRWMAIEPMSTDFIKLINDSGRDTSAEAISHTTAPPIKE